MEGMPKPSPAAGAEEKKKRGFGAWMRATIAGTGALAATGAAVETHMVYGDHEAKPIEHKLDKPMQAPEIQLPGGGKLEVVLPAPLAPAEEVVAREPEPVLPRPLDESFDQPE